MNQPLLDLLLRSFDCELTREEQSELRRGLAEDAMLRDEKKRIEEMRQMLHKEAARSFRPFFSARVMRKINEKATAGDDFGSALIWAFRRVALAGAVAILLLLANTFFVEKSGSLDSALGMPELTLEDTWQLDNLLAEETL